MHAAHVGIFFVVFVQLLQLLLVVRSQPTRNFTVEEYSYAAALGAAYEVVDNTTLSGLVPRLAKWYGIAYAPNTGLLYCAPYNTNSVLIINQLANTTDTTTLGGLLAGADFRWRGIAFAPNTGMLYCAPFTADSVLIINPLTNTTDNTTLSGLGTSVQKCEDIAFAPNTGLLYCAPSGADSVLMINPLTNTTDNTTIGRLGTGVYKWQGIAFVPTTGILYCAPYNADSVLIINPLTNTTDTSTLGGFVMNGGKWQGIAFASTTGMLYCAPRNASSVLMINPLTNTTDNTTLGGFGTGVDGNPLGNQCRGIAFAPTTGKLYCAPWNADSVLMIDPLTNTTNTTALGGLGAGGGKWNGIAFAPSTGMLYCAPYNAASVLTIGTFIDSIVRQSAFRLIAAQLNSTINSLHTIIDTLQSDSLSQMTEIDSLQTMLSSQQSTIETLVYNLLRCGNGTTPSNGMCVPDCDTLQRRGVTCEPYCDEDPLQSSDNNNDSLPFVISGVVFGVILAFAVGFVVIRYFARKSSKSNRASQRETFPHQPHIATMYMNPLHQDADTQLDYEEPITLNSEYIEATGSVSEVVLDAELYVAPASLRSGVENEYQMFRSGSPSDDQYRRFQSVA